MALGDAILACLTERPMTGYELAKTFDSSIGFFWKADHQQIYRELSKLRDRGYKGWYVLEQDVMIDGDPPGVPAWISASVDFARTHGRA